MSKKLIIPIIIIVVLGILYFSFQGKYNTMVQLDEGVKSKWAQVESQYQRRADLIPNLVSTVKGYAKFEQETLTKVIEARSKATAVNIDPSNLSPEAIQQFQQAQGGLSSALSRLMVVLERYPDLKANQNFMGLQAQLEGTENRIAVERNRFNGSVEQYNSYIRKFPANIFAGMFNFSPKGYFKSDEGAQNAPKVEF